MNKSYAVAIVPTAGCTYPELFFCHKNLENIQQRIFRKEKKISPHVQPGFKLLTYGFMVYCSTT